VARRVDEWTSSTEFAQQVPLRLFIVVGLKKINQAMMQMGQGAQQNAAMVEEATAASVALNDEAQTLKALATRFSVSGSGNAVVLASVARKMRAPATSAPSPRSFRPS
jgi:methyl-accepting chemotaxis protein